MKLALVISLFFVASASSMAAEIQQTEVTRDKQRYKVNFEVLLDAPVERVGKYLADYDNLKKISDTVIESQVLVREEKHQRVKIVLRPCVLFFCRTIRRTVDIEFIDDGQVLTLAPAPDNDFRYSHERWSISADDQRARLRYVAEVEPGFFVPPLIGPWIVKSTIIEELETTTRKLEALSHAP